MESGGGKTGEGGGEMMRKLWQGVTVVGKRGGPTTPSTTWRLELLPRGESKGLLLHPTPPSLSARKLCAGLWEFQPPMSRRYPRRHDHGHPHPRGMGLDPSAEPPDLMLQPASNRDPSRHVFSALKREYYPIRDDAAHQPIHDEGCSSSVEESHVRRSSFRPSTFDLKRGVGESSSSPRMSTELLKVLNRIWSLEERHTSNKSILRGLRSELDQSRLRIKELMREKRNDKQLLENLLKQVWGDKFVGNQEESDEVKAEAEAHLLNEELENERSLRNNAEGLHRKLAKEFDELKGTYLGGQQELERERKARILLESLCDEFAKGIRDYEQVVRCLTNKPVKQSIGRECLDGLILHISEAWLDERLQMRLSEGKGDSSGKSSIVDKLNSDIETFLLAKQKDGNICPSLMEGRPSVAGEDKDQSPCISLEGDNGELTDAVSRVGKLNRRRWVKCEGVLGKQRPTKVRWGGKSWSSSVREGTLMAKLLEARMEGQEFHSKAF